MAFPTNAKITALVCNGRIRPKLNQEMPSVMVGNKNMNANGDGTMDWFFNQWVHSTEVPVYQCDIKIQSLGEGMFQLAGSVGQKDVSDNFKAMVPLYAVFDKGRFIKLTDMPFKGSMSRKINTKLRLPQAPKEITVNFNHDLLARSED